jgi:hypothetical protein
MPRKGQQETLPAGCRPYSLARSPSNDRASSHFTRSRIRAHQNRIVVAREITRSPGLATSSIVAFRETMNAPKPRPCEICGHGPVSRRSLAGEQRDADEVNCPVCGKYRLDNLLAMDIAAGGLGQRRHWLSGVLRNASDEGVVHFVENGNLDSLLASARSPATPLDVLEPILDRAARRTPTFADRFALRHVDYAKFFLRTPDELKATLEFLARLGWIEPLIEIDNSRWESRLTVEGWRHLQSVRDSLPDSRLAFVAMSFDSSLNDAWLHGIKPALDETGYSAFRVDAHEHNGRIDDVIMSQLRRSGLIVADFTGHRGGVYFEAGFGLGRGIPVIWTARTDAIAGSHFDTRQYNHIVWDTPNDLRKKLQTRIEATLTTYPSKSVQALTGTE